MTEITQSELQAEYARIDALRIRERKKLLTDEQFDIIRYARENKSPVPWSRMAKYFKEKG